MRTLKNTQRVASLMGLLFASITLTTSCSNEEEIQKQAEVIVDQDADVYITGVTESGVGLWRNGIPTTLTNNGSETTALYVSGSDVYLLAHSITNEKGIKVPTYWKNEEKIELTDGTNNAGAYSMTVVGTDVYVAGFETISGKTIAKYWKNGDEIVAPPILPEVPETRTTESNRVTTATSLTDGTNNAVATSIVVNGTDIYVSGYESNGSKTIAKLWINGVATALSNGSNNTYTSAMVVVGTDTYIVGYEQKGLLSTAKYWKNTTETALTDGTKNAIARSIAVDGTDVYIAGFESNGTNDVAKYWKNGEAVSLSDGSHNAYARSIAIIGGNIYVAGLETNGTSFGAKFWKNGVANWLFGGTIAHSIFLVGK